MFRTFCQRGCYPPAPPRKRQLENSFDFLARDRTWNTDICEVTYALSIRKKGLPERDELYKDLTIKICIYYQKSISRIIICVALLVMYIRLLLLFIIYWFVHNLYRKRVVFVLCLWWMLQFSLFIYSPLTCHVIRGLPRYAPTSRPPAFGAVTG